MEEFRNQLLAPYRVLDLTDEKGFLTGKMLGDMGAEVIKVERPGGDPARMIGPFYHDAPHPERSLYWFAFNSGKKGITLNLETARGRELFKTLVKTAGFVIESFPPGYLDELGLGYRALGEVNPNIIVTSISAFGQTGPYRDYRGSDLVCMAMGGVMSITGDRDRAPLRLGFDQAYCLASANAAVGTLIAHRHRQETGEGQQVDVSICECVVRLFDIWGSPFWEFAKMVPERMGNRSMTRPGINRFVWACKDGYMTWYAVGGEHGARENAAMLEWLNQEGMADAEEVGKLKGVDFSMCTGEQLHDLERAISTLFLKHSKTYLEEVGRERGVRLVALRDLQDVLESDHLAVRGFWSEIQHPELEIRIKYPGHFFISTVAEIGVRFRAPLIGEHNQEIYGAELGLTEQQLGDLKESDVV